MAFWSLQNTDDNEFLSIVCMSWSRFVEHPNNLPDDAHTELL